MCSAAPSIGKGPSIHRRTHHVRVVFLHQRLDGLGIDALPLDHFLIEHACLLKCCPTRRQDADPKREQNDRNEISKCAIIRASAI
jgi:hypothetical protein